MLLCCCPPRSAVGPAPPSLAPPLKLDLVADLPSHTRDSSAFTNDDVKDSKKVEEEKSNERFICDTKETDIPSDVVDDPLPPRSPSIRVEDFSEKTNPSVHSLESQQQSENTSRKSLVDSRPPSIPSRAPSRQLSRNSTPSHSRSATPSQSRSATPSQSRSATPSPLKTPKSGHFTPELTSEVYVKQQSPACERDVRNAIAECIVPVKLEDWEIIVNGLLELERLSTDSGARAPAATWRAAVRSTAGHVRSLRSRVARAACSTLAALFEYRGRALDPELEEAAAALLDRCADVNRFLRADAASALVRLARGSNYVRAVVALSRRGATHRAGPVRAAAAQALSKLVEHNGPSKILDLPSDPRTVFLRTAGELLGDAHPETRVHARQLCLLLSEDTRFLPMLKDAMLPTRYKAIEKFVDKLKCR